MIPDTSLSKTIFAKILIIDNGQVPSTLLLKSIKRSVTLEIKMADVKSLKYQYFILFSFMALFVLLFATLLKQD